MVDSLPPELHLIVVLTLERHFALILFQNNIIFETFFFIRISMDYRHTKRDAKMHERRKNLLKMPDAPLTEIVLEKY